LFSHLNSQEIKKYAYICDKHIIGNMASLGKMKRITELRSVWPHEAHDFTKWLAEEENLKELSDSIGI